MPPTALFRPLKVGALTLPNRFVMAPLTRCRADVPGHVPNAMMAEMYSQRASAGLLIAEATMVAEGHSAFFSEPGVFSKEQVEGWKLTTQAVHAKNGRIFLQIVHPGRAAHSINDGEQPVAPTAAGIEGHQIGPEFNRRREKINYEVPRALTEGELPGIVKQFVAAATNAMEAGFDGVELHAANGYLLDQFLRDGINRRTDRYGGSIENRARLLLEVAAGVKAAIGADRIGVRISPVNSYNGGGDSDPEGLTRYVAAELGKLGIAYLHVMRADFFGIQKGDVEKWARESFPGVLITNMGYDADTAEAAIAAGRVDAVAFGTKFLANPDFVERSRDGKPLNALRPELFYGPGPAGYIDYPLATA